MRRGLRALCAEATAELSAIGLSTVVTLLDGDEGCAACSSLRFKSLRFKVFARD
eukprot:SAG11_NODE_157_length_14147_cov_8.545202_9_plen_54_part_00